jgi:predicted acetyltransferase
MGGTVGHAGQEDWSRGHGAMVWRAQRSNGGGLRGSNRSEWRSTGVGAALMRDALGWMRGRGLALSTLFPATQSVYRTVEQAGMNYVYEQPIATLLTDRDGLAVRRAHKSDRETLQRLYAERAAHTAGNLDRDARFWDDVLESKREQVDVYLVEQEKLPRDMLHLRTERTLMVVFIRYQPAIWSHAHPRPPGHCWFSPVTVPPARGYSGLDPQPIHCACTSPIRTGSPHFW